MRNQLISLVILSGLLCIAASCHHEPQPPLEQAISFSQNSANAYCQAEKEYASLWFDHHKDLVKLVSAELAGREYSLPEAPGHFNDTINIAGGKWRIFVKEGKEVHARGTGSLKNSDKVLFAENDPAFRVRLRNSSSNNYIFIETSSGDCSEVRMLNTSSQSLNPTLIQERKAGVYYQVDHFGGSNVWILTNEHAPNRCIMIAPVNSPGPGRWKAVIRENDSVFIDDYTVIDQQYLVLVQKKHLNASVEITGIYPESNNEPPVENKINFPEPDGSISDLFYDRKEDKIVFRYSSIITPPTCYTYGLHSMHLGIRWKKQIRNYNQDDYQAQVILTVGKDNSRIPVSLIRKRNPESPDDHKFLLLFIDSVTSCRQNITFRSDILSLLDRGFTVAFLHIPSRISSGIEHSDMITSTVAALIKEKDATQGLITLAGSKQAARAAWKATAANSSWYSVLIMDSPMFPGISGNLKIPSIYLHADTTGQDQALRSLSLAADIRKLAKPGNILIVSVGNEGNRPPEMNARLIAFILTSYGIDK